MDVNQPSSYGCDQCSNGGKCAGHRYLGHFANKEVINAGHNTVLSAAARNALPTKTFAGPDRSYPIPDASHARNALARGAQFAAPALLKKIKAKVAKKFPGIQES